jgi:hypothetical protein
MRPPWSDAPRVWLRPEEDHLSRKRHRSREITAKLRQVDVLRSQSGSSLTAVALPRFAWVKRRERSAAQRVEAGAAVQAPPAHCSKARWGGLAG